MSDDSDRRRPRRPARGGDPRPFDAAPASRSPLAARGGRSGRGARRRREARGERRERVLSMDTETFMAIPAPSPRTTFEPPEFDQREGRIGLSTAFFSIATAASRIAGLVREIVAAELLRHHGADVGLHDRLPGPEPGPQPVRRRGDPGRLRPGLHRRSSSRGTAARPSGSPRTMLFLVDDRCWERSRRSSSSPRRLVIPLFAPGFEGELLDLTVTLSQLLFPILILLGITGVVVGVLNSYDRFARLRDLAVLLERRDHRRAGRAGAGVLRGGPDLRVRDRRPGRERSIQLAIPAWDLRHTTVPDGLAAATGAARSATPDVRRVLVADAAGHDQPRADQLQPGHQQLLRHPRLRRRRRRRSTRPSASTCCPQGIFSVAIATVALPDAGALRRARGVSTTCARTMANGMRQILLMLVPAAAAILVLSEPMTRLVYERGEFDAAQTELVAEALFWFAFSLPLNGLFLIFTRTFFSLQRPWVPTAISGVNLAITALASPAPLRALRRRRASSPRPRSPRPPASSPTPAILRGDLRRHRVRAACSGAPCAITAAAALLAAVSYLVWLGLDDALGHRRPRPDRLARRRARRRRGGLLRRRDRPAGARGRPGAAPAAPRGRAV